MKTKEIIRLIEKLPEQETERLDRTLNTFVLSRPLHVQVEVHSFSLLKQTRNIYFKIKKINIAYSYKQLLVHLIDKNNTIITLTKNEAIYLLKNKKLTKDVN